jgi:hypothetical protein
MATPYDTGLDKNPANYQPLTPLVFLERAARGIGKGDTVSAMLANSPAMLDAHYGVPMTGAVLLKMKTPEPELFRSGRQFAARIGAITRAGDEGLRSVLVVRATVLIQHVRRSGRSSPWLTELLKRKLPKLAAVALANKMVRIAWKLGRSSVWNSRRGNHLASVHVQAHKQAGHMDASDLIKALQTILQGPSHPHMGNVG